MLPGQKIPREKVLRKKTPWKKVPGKKVSAKAFSVREIIGKFTKGIPYILNYGKLVRGDFSSELFFQETFFLEIFFLGDLLSGIIYRDLCFVRQILQFVYTSHSHAFKQIHGFIFYIKIANMYLKFINLKWTFPNSILKFQSLF